MKIKKLNNHGFHLIYVLLALLGVGLIVGVGIYVFHVQQQRQQEELARQQAVDRNNPFIKEFGTNCEEKPRVVFTHSPIASDQVGYIEPLGRMRGTNVLPTSKAYIYPPNPDASDNSYNVVMPAEGRVVFVESLSDERSDHRVVVAFSCQYFAIFNHVNRLSERIKQEVGDLEANEPKQASVPLSGGTPIGTTDGRPVEWTMVDVKSQLEGLISPYGYDKHPWIIHTIDPFSVYSGSLRQELEEKSLRTEQPIGGKTDYDRRTRLVGNWFKVGTNGYEGSDEDRFWQDHLALAPNNIDPRFTVVSFGNWQGEPAQFAVRGRVDPSIITERRSPVKYELLPLVYETPEAVRWQWRDGFVRGLEVSQRGTIVGTILVEVREDQSIRIEKFPGRNADQVNTFTANAEIFER